MGNRKELISVKYLYKTKSIFFSWLLSYILILIITLIIIIVSYWESIKVIQHETNKVYLASLKQLQQVVDSTLSDIQRLSVEVSLNARISSLINSNETLDNLDRVEMTKIISDLKTYKIANSYIDKLYIYFKNSDYIISSDARYDTEDFYDLNYNKYKIEFEDWKTLIKEKHRLHYLPLNIDESETVRNNIAFMQSLPVTQRNANDATLVIEISEEAIRKTIGELQWVSQGTIFIQDKSDNIIVSTQPRTENLVVKYDELDKKQNIFNGKINKEKVVISYIKSNITDWQYVSVISTSIFLERAKYVYRIFFACVILCLVIGGFIAYILTKRNYNPVDKLINIFNSKPDLFKKYSDNEYDFIESSIINIINEKEKVYSELDKQMDTLRNNFLSRLIKGQLDTNISIDDACESYKISLKEKGFLVGLFYLEDFSNSYFEINKVNISSDETIKNAQFIMKNIIEEMIKEIGYGYFVVVNDIPACLINIKLEENKDLKQIIYSTIVKAKEYIESKFGIYFSASISNVYSTIDDIDKAYQEAIEVLEYQMLIGNNKIILYDEIKSAKVKYSKQNNYISEGQQFSNCIRAGDYKNAKIILSEIFKTNFLEPLNSIQMSKCRMFNLINIMLVTISENTTIDNDYIESLNIDTQLFKCKSISELQEKMMFIIDKLDKYIEEKKEINYNGLLQNIINFIDINISNVDLSVSMIADNFNISIVNLSKFFKKNTGIGMLDYINKLRIEKAKMIIKVEDLSIKEIGERVGYYNSAAFIRVFKKYEGITPGKHKEAF